MTPCHPRPTRWLAIVVAAFALVLIVVPRAQAFTVEDSGTNADGSAKFSDPDSRFSTSGKKDGAGVQQFGNTTIKFGTSQPNGAGFGLNHDYEADKNRMFDPLGRPGQ